MKITQKMVQTYFRNKSAVIVAEKENTVLVRLDEEDYSYYFETLIVLKERLYPCTSHYFHKQEYDASIVDHIILMWNREWCENSTFVIIHAYPDKRSHKATVCFFNKETETFEEVDIKPVSWKKGAFWCFKDKERIGFGRTEYVEFQDSYGVNRSRARSDIYLRDNGDLRCVVEDIDMGNIASCYNFRRF